MTRRIIGAVGVSVALLAAHGKAQTATLAFMAEEGQSAYRLFQAHTIVSEDAVNGSVRRREAAKLGRVHERVLARSDGRYVLHVAVDSLVLRTRDADGPWHETVPTDVRPWAQFEVDARLAVHRRVGDDGETPLLHYLLAGFPGLLLPERAVWTGRVWRQELEVPASDVTLGAVPDAGAVRLPIVMTVAVDSVVARARDTLAYVTVEGQVAPSRVRSADGRAIEYRGSVAGSLVWSSGWRRFVSAATRSVVTVGRHEGAVSSNVTIQTTVRQAVRPTP